MRAFTQLRHLLEPRIRRFVCRLIGYTGHEDDIIQDVFLALYLNLERMTPPEKLLPFVYRVARNRSYDLLRKYHRHPEEDLAPHADYLPEAHLTAEDHTHWLVIYEDVRCAIDDLPTLQRQTMILYAEEHLSYAEIAEVMNTEIGTVKSRMYHARRALRARIDPDILENLKNS